MGQFRAFLYLPEEFLICILYLWGDALTHKMEKQFLEQDWTVSFPMSLITYGMRHASSCFLAPSGIVFLNVAVQIQEETECCHLE